MRLLPDEEWANRRRRIVAVRIRHLRPARAGVTLSFRQRLGFRQNSVVVREAAFEHWQAVPQREMRRVPPVHLQMEFSLPRIVSEPGFLRRIDAGALDRGEVLREHDATFEFMPARILAA